MPPDGGDRDLGPWKESELADTARQNPGTGADADLAPEVRFISGVAKLLQRRNAESAAAADPPRPAVFLLEPSPQIRPGTLPRRVPMLNNGLTPVTGRLWFVSPVVVAGSYITIPEGDDEHLFQVVTDDLGLGSVPAILYDPRTSVPEVRFYPRGLGHPESVEPVAARTSDASLSRILEVVDQVYTSMLITPEAQARAGKLWEDSSRWYPSAQAEDIVQLYIRAGLTTAFPTCTIRHEQTGVPGRLDLEIEESDPLDRSRITRYAVLELKVLRSFRSTGTVVTQTETRDWVDSGVRQAATYRDDRGASASALCCFDMRRTDTGEECFTHVRELAASLNVTLKVWFIYATSEQYRQAITESR